MSQSKEKAQVQPVANGKAPVVSFDLMKRPRVMAGQTYKLKTPTLDEAVYVTINDIETPYGYRPLEIFINARVMESWQWIQFSCRMMSAIFRSYAKVEQWPTFVVEEMTKTWDPGHRYWSQHYKGQFMNSVVHEIGFILREHCEDLGCMPKRKRVQKATEPQSNGGEPNGDKTEEHETSPDSLHRRARDCRLQSK